MMNWEATPADTTPEAWAVQLDVYRRMPPTRRLELGLQMSDSLRHVVACGIRTLPSRVQRRSGSIGPRSTVARRRSLPPGLSRD